ncbi:TPA: hypothetical protein I7738_20025 [Vibrio vulnificus]|nr:hypothetical protein [Vibrio vulnificus]
MTQFELENLELSRNSDNYKIIFTGTKNGKCLVLFSSNGLYFPNTYSALQKIIDDDRFEWQSLSPNNFEKIIFLRDTYKQWYVCGINKSIDSPSKVISFLEKETQGFWKRFLGSSAGGYAAVYYGSKCNADSIVSISGQFDLSFEAKDEHRNKILFYEKNRLELDVSSTSSSVIYVYPYLSSYDIEQYNRIKNNRNIKVIPVKSSSHGVPIYSFGVRKFISADDSTLQKFSNKKNSKLAISMTFIDWKDLLFKIRRKVIKYLRIKID